MENKQLDTKDLLMNKKEELSSVPDGLHLCLYVKDVIDDVDGYDGIAFNRWYADMCRKGIQVDWYNCR
jgi:hypothetical protein